MMLKYLVLAVALSLTGTVRAQSLLEVNVNVSSAVSAQCQSSKLVTSGPVQANCLNQNLQNGVVGSALAFANYNRINVDTQITVPFEQGGALEPAAVASASFQDQLFVSSPNAAYLRMHAVLNGAEYIFYGTTQKVQLTATNSQVQSQACTISVVYKSCDVTIALQTGQPTMIQLALNVQLSFGGTEDPPIPAAFQYLSTTISKTDALDGNMKVIPNASITSFSGTVYAQ